MARDIYQDMVKDMPVLPLYNPYPLFETRKIDPVKVKSKPGRNESCPCHSGIKYKKCCGGK